MADTTADVEAVARAIYDLDPMFLPIGERIDGVEVARRLSFDDAPTYRQEGARRFAYAAIAADSGRKRMEEALRALARPDGFVRSSIEEEKKARMAFARAALEGGEL